MKLLVSILALAATLTTAGLAAARSPTHQALIDSTVRFLQESQRASGGFAPPGAPPSQGTSAWVALALAAAGINPQDQARCGSDAYSFLVGHFHQGFEEEIPWPQIATTAFERELLVVDAAGTDPHEFAGYDLVAEILGRQLPDGSFPYIPGGRGEANDTIFAILALSPIHELAAEEAIEQGVEWLIAQQDEDGGWYYSGKSAASEVDMTGAAIEALVAAGPPPGERQRAAFAEAEKTGLEYLKRSQLPDGGFPALPDRERESNVASTAWAVQAIWAVGENPEEWTVGSGAETREPLDYMESMQQPDGHIRWRASSDLNGIWMTAYVTPAFAGQALPIPTAPRDGPRASHGVAASCQEPGEGGESPRAGKGVLTGGGGTGAPLFSRPKPQSKGKTPGGARVIHNQTLHPQNDSETRRGANTRQPTGTQASEPSNRQEPARAEQSSLATAGASAGDGSDGTGPSASSESPGTSSGPGGSAALSALAEEARGAAADRGGREVSGTLIGSTGAGRHGPLAFGAPGLHSAGAGSGGERWIAVGIGGAALLAALGGAGWERRRREAVL